MNYLYEQDKEQKEKELFEKCYKKQVVTTNKVVLLVFLVIGLIFSTIGIGLLIGQVEDEGMLVGLPFFIMGVFFIILGIIVKFSNSKIPDYEKFKKRVNKYGGYYTTDMAVRLEMLEEKNRELEERIEYLERRK